MGHGQVAREEAGVISRRCLLKAASTVAWPARARGEEAGRRHRYGVPP